MASSVPPKAKDIGFEALDDLKAAWPDVKKIILMLLAPLSLLQFITETLSDAPKQNALLIILISLISMWITVDYVIRWHRYTLRHGDMSYSGSWYKPDHTYFQFFMRCALFLVPIIVAFIVSIGVGSLINIIAGPFLKLFGVLVVFGLIFWAIYATLRLMFILPASSVEHDIRILDLYKLSKGLILKISWAPVRATWKYILGGLFYFFLAGVIIVAIAGVEPSTTQRVLEFIFITIPGLIMGMLFGFICAGVLSKYYLWALQHRSLSHA